MSPSRLLDARYQRPARKLSAVPAWPASFAIGSLPRVFCNSRADVDHNTCGQAAAATVLAHFHAGPFGTEDPIADGVAIDRVRENFPPDAPFGFGTSAYRIMAALHHFGLHAEIVHSGPFGGGMARAIERVMDHVALGIPVPVCVNDGALGNRPWSAHWAAALLIEDAHVVLGNSNPAVVPLDRFLAAWRCRHLPWPHHHCSILASR